MKLSAITFLVLCLCQWTQGAPYQSVHKKDIHLSRGWGAGGMPFSILYLNPTFSASKAPLTVKNGAPPLVEPFQPIHRNSVGIKTKRPPRHRTVMKIPQLFVSYEWPVGA